MLVRTVEARRWHDRMPHVLEAMAGATTSTAVAPARAWIATGGTLGWLEIPRLGVSAPVRAGADPLDLALAVGHVARTAFPGEPGNAVLAAHRDGYFRALERVAVGDTVLVTTLDGRFAYQVESTQIVLPDRIDVMAPPGTAS